MHSYGPAVRPHYLIHFIFSGKGSYLAGGKTNHLCAGDAFLIQPGETTYYEADEKEPWTYAWTAFHGDEAEPLLSTCGLGDQALIYRGQPDDRLMRYAKTLADCFGSTRHSQLEMIGYLYLILSIMQKDTADEDNKDQESYCKKACDYIKNNFSYDIRITDIARYIGIDRTYLYKVFIKERGISPKQYLLERRLAEAQNLLSHTSLSVTEAAYSCGFKDTPSFCRHFKAAVGMTPSQFRKIQFR